VISELTADVSRSGVTLRGKLAALEARDEELGQRITRRGQGIFFDGAQQPGRRLRKNPFVLNAKTGSERGSSNGYAGEAQG
jgi:hypothetical protein